MQNASFLLTTSYFARFCLSSDLIPFNYEATAVKISMPSHRNFFVFCHEYLVAVRIIGGPSTV